MNAIVREPAVRDVRLDVPPDNPPAAEQIGTSRAYDVAHIARGVGDRECPDRRFRSAMSSVAERHIGDAVANLS